MKVGQLIVIKNDIYEIIKIDFGCLVYCNRYYNEEIVDIKEFDISEVEKAINRMKREGIGQSAL